jgi:hypothetical protein
MNEPPEVTRLSTGMLRLKRSVWLSLQNKVKEALKTQRHPEC